MAKIDLEKAWQLYNKKYNSLTKEEFMQIFPNFLQFIQFSPQMVEDIPFLLDNKKSVIINLKTIIKKINDS